MSHNRSSGFKTFHAKQYKAVQLTSHVLIMMLEVLYRTAILDFMPGGEDELTAFDISRAILFHQWFGYLILEI